MAEHLVSIYGTEKDKVNCPFYYKIGACRHGDRCSRVHNKPLFSQTLLLHNLYQSPDQIIASAAAQSLPPPDIPPDDLRHHFDDFYADVLHEMLKHGPVDELRVCENLADHLAGNTYVKFADEESAQNALNALHGRWYAGRPVLVEFSPVTDFREGKCRPFERYGQCERGDYCHFMHLRRHPGGTRPDDHDPRPDRLRYPHSSRDKYRDYPPRDSRDYPRYQYDDRRSERDRREGPARYRERSRPKSRERGRYSDYDKSYKSTRERKSPYHD
ncbi:Splicing factor U2af small subunit B [Chondrus crispus]|uniref:Splicing factor U2af small subunit B n=1 Tax=Chondrus crispus TaxID=2769 RepID=R7QB72_CHOCR|nr:Splicing factor U2af small subunit B [Chondrus crispus]CDF34671.1 Splicing factor U2af small subunit B [Chondrus crispus]|eukprot:XP_005714490.1 Splicing factor U2af small subunit B [Chondrus crispus]